MSPPIRCPTVDELKKQNAKDTDDSKNKRVDDLIAELEGIKKQWQDALKDLKDEKAKYTELMKDLRTVKKTFEEI